MLYADCAGERYCSTRTRPDDGPIGAVRTEPGVVLSFSFELGDTCMGGWPSNSILAFGYAFVMSLTLFFCALF
ncbi:hypothetical protein AWW66_07045 [Micromonospora rosaria]|uniref:Uncharacterized protein n=1 Tax=Micromonospora rosaria TaxID=47874 RepID=A0A136PW88_9ACTN|nr:hypothetical protein [Micromonospora rosaria]KXK62672.1 hypothetical protein AWW66_07045 [Micromonospora rosaria]